MLFCDPQEEYGGGKLCAKNGTWSEILAPHSSIIDCGCHMPETCLWQTCRYGNSSQEWSVNCGLEDSGCQDAVAGAGLGAECDEFTGAGDCLLGCDACYNTECPECGDTWLTCRNTLTASNIDTCPDTPRAGDDCGLQYCDGAGVSGWTCPGYQSNTTRVLVGDSCLLFCNGQLGGSRTCSQQRTWVDNMPSSCH